MTAPSIDAVSGVVEELRHRCRHARPEIDDVGPDEALLLRAADALEAQARELADARTARVPKFEGEVCDDVELDMWRAASAICKANGNHRNMPMCRLLARYEQDMATAQSRIAALEDAVRVNDEALSPFAEFAQWTDAEGWTCNIHREGISVWFGPSDFRRARTALSNGEAK